MSDYFLADRKAAERAKMRANERDNRNETTAENIKVTLLGDFLFPSIEPQGCDPYNSQQGKATRDAWRSRRNRR